MNQSANLQQSFARAVEQHRQGNLAGAERLYRELLPALPGNPDLCLMLGTLCAQQGRNIEALTWLESALQSDPRSFDALLNHGLVLQRLGRPRDALASFDRALSQQPRHAALLYNRGVALSALEDFGAALASYDAAVAAQPDYAEAWHNRGVVLTALKHFDAALASYNTGLAIRPDYVSLFYNRGVTLAELGRIDEALADYEAALAREPGHADAAINRANILRAQGRLDAALACHDAALALQPAHAGLLYNRGVILGDLGRAEEALASYDAALAARPGYVEALHNRGFVLAQLQRFEEAVCSYDAALAAAPDSADIWNNRGSALRALGRFEDALKSYDRAVNLKPDFVEALSNRGNMQWTEMRRFEPARRDLEDVVRIDPHNDYALGDLLHLKMYGGDWRDVESLAARVTKGVRAGRRVVKPFVYQAISDVPADLMACSAIYAAHRYPPRTPLRQEAYRDHAKIRVGYLSGEFREQATAYLMAGLYERHDRSRFEITAFDSGGPDNSPMRKRLTAAFDGFVDISNLSDLAAAEKIRASEIDILINLNGYFGKMRMGVFAHRPAPVQVNYLGFPATLGAPYIDYIIGDRFVIPPGEEQFYAEKVVRLPGSYQANDCARAMAPATSRAAHGLPPDAFVFCNFNQSYKLAPDTFTSWMRILERVPGSVLWLLENTAQFAVNMRREAEARGVDGARLIFAPMIAAEAHLARLALAGLFLDSLPYNAHTTASDSLWAGVPLVTRRGSALAGRVATSLLHAVGLPELVTQSADDFEALAVALATDTARLASIRGALARNRGTAPLFDTESFRRHLEAAYERMQDIRAKEQPPRSFDIEP